MLYHVCRPLNTWHGVLFGLMGVLFILVICVIPGWVQLVPLDYQTVT